MTKVVQRVVAKLALEHRLAGLQSLCSPSSSCPSTHSFLLQRPFSPTQLLILAHDPKSLGLPGAAPLGSPGFGKPVQCGPLWSPPHACPSNVRMQGERTHTRQLWTHHLLRARCPCPRGGASPVTELQPPRSIISPGIRLCLSHTHTPVMSLTVESPFSDCHNKTFVTPGNQSSSSRESSCGNAWGWDGQGKVPIPEAKSVTYLM